MPFNKKERLLGNIEALRLVFALDKERRAATESEREQLQNYCGFGGLKCVLNPASSLMDVVSWSKSEAELFGSTLKLHNLLKENSASEAEYRGYVSSLKGSVLTAFYTPPAVVSAIADTLKESGITPKKMLDPSARGRLSQPLQGIEQMSWRLKPCKKCPYRVLKWLSYISKIDLLLAHLEPLLFCSESQP